MFTADNCEFDAAARAELNKALDALMAEHIGDDDDQRDQVEQSYSDMLNNAWFEGATADQLTAAVHSQHK